VSIHKNQEAGIRGLGDEMKKANSGELMGTQGNSRRSFSRTEGITDGKKGELRGIRRNAGELKV
jgi:hypothetical protein